MVKTLPAVQRENLQRSLQNLKRSRFDPWVRKITWNREWLPIPVFLLGKSHGQRSLQAIVHVVAKSWTQLSN